MGTWGFGIFEDDFTLDIKDYFKQFKDEGISVNQSIARLKRLNSDIINNQDLGPDLIPLFYIGLAATLRENNVLIDEVKTEALNHLSSKSGMDPWREAGLLSYFRRKMVLMKFKQQLIRTKCIEDQSVIDLEDVNSNKFDPNNQKFHVYEITFASGKRLIGNTVHPESRMKFFESRPLK